MDSDLSNVLRAAAGIVSASYGVESDDGSSVSDAKLCVESVADTLFEAVTFVDDANDEGAEFNRRRSWSLS